MKASQFTDAQKAFILKQGAEGMPVAEICRKAGISQATYFNWKKKYDGHDAAGDAAAEAARGREHEAAQAGGRSVARPRDAAGRHPPKTLRPGRKRELVDAVRREWDVSIRRACRVLEFDTSTYHYRSRRPDQAGLKARIKEICATRVRYGYRRVHVLLRREGWDVNHKRTYKLYRELGLQLRNKTPKRRVKAKLRDDRHPATRPNDVWAMDFLHDQLATGEKIRVLTVVDTFSRFSPVLDARFSYRGEDVVQTLDTGLRRRSAIRRRSGSTRAREFVSRDLDLWAYAQGRHARLLPARQADRQCLRRSVQQPRPGGVHERPLVPDPCGCARKDGGLAQILQRGSPARGDRP